MVINRMRPIHPGEQLRDELDEIGLSARALARSLGVPTNRITEILCEKRGISADTALRLAQYFGTAPEFWLNLQSAYELRLARLRSGREIELTVKPCAA